jgi:hypothetical protein
MLTMYMLLHVYRSDEDSEASGDQSVEEESLTEESGDWAPQRSWHGKKGRSRGGGGRYNRYDDDFGE